MYKGTTPTFTIRLCGQIDLEEDTSEIWVTIKDSAGELHNWTKTDLELEDNIIYLTLSQTETLGIASGRAELQVRILTGDNKALASKIAIFDADDVLKGGVIS